MSLHLSTPLLESKHTTSDNKPDPMASFKTFPKCAFTFFFFFNCSENFGELFADDRIVDGSFTEPSKIC